MSGKLPVFLIPESPCSPSLSIYLRYSSILCF